MVRSDEARKRFNENANKQRARQKTYQTKKAKSLETRVKSMRRKIKKEILESIDDCCKNSSYLAINHYERNSSYFGDDEKKCLDNEARPIAIEKVISQLERAPYNYSVKRKRREDFDGEGSNYHDFFTYRSWTISWV